MFRMLIALFTLAASSFSLHPHMTILNPVTCLYEYFPINGFSYYRRKSTLVLQIADLSIIDWITRRSHPRLLLPCLLAYDTHPQ